MAEERSDQHIRDPEGIDHELSPGGRSSRGPNADPGGETVPGGLVPPYEGRTTARGESQISEELTDSVERTYGGAHGGGTSETASPAMESPVRPDEVSHEAPDSPLGVGEYKPPRGRPGRPRRQRVRAQRYGNRVRVRTSDWGVRLPGRVWCRTPRIRGLRTSRRGEAEPLGRDSR